MNIGTNIKNTIKENGYNIAEFCRKIQVSRQALYAILNGNTLPAIDTLINIAKALDVSLDYLVYGEKSKESEIQSLYDSLSYTNQLALLSYAEGLAYNQNGYIPVHIEKPPIELNKK